jgi:light-regulated signal transduction histidine kinase (bacteriophytochrome)
MRDNGIGVDPKRAEEVFEPFRRLHSSSKFEGCGIGLSICRKVIDRHAGRIWFDTDCETGAHVRFTLGQQKLDAS